VPPAPAPPGIAAAPERVARPSVATIAVTGPTGTFGHCKNCHPGAIAGRWTREQVIAAMRAWRNRYGRPPSSYDWSRTHATRRRGEAATRRRGEAATRLAEDDWPAPGTVSDLFGTWAAARRGTRPMSAPNPAANAAATTTAVRRARRRHASFFIDKLGAECGDLQRPLRELTVNATAAIAAYGNGATGAAGASGPS
jgi:hypothetical protein